MKATLCITPAHNSQGHVPMLLLALASSRARCRPCSLALDARASISLGAAGASLSGASWRTVLEDDRMLVVDKDAGLLTVPGRGAEKADCLLSRLAAAGHPECLHAPHRLDRDTSGLIVLGRDPEAHRHLSVQFQDKRVRKQYAALVLGWPSDDEGSVDAPIGKVRLPGDEHARMRIVPPGTPKGRASLTRWRVIERCEADTSERFARVELTPVTGRAHQLRLHMQLLGHPILGDELHGSPAAVAAANRLCLHAAQLDFERPGGAGERMQVQAPVPF